MRAALKVFDRAPRRCGLEGRVRRETRASALVLVLWAVMLLSMAILAWAQWIQHGVTLSGEASGNADARAMSHSGVAMALNPMVGELSPQLNRQFGAQLGYRVRMVSEGGKLNLSWLLLWKLLVFHYLGNYIALKLRIISNENISLIGRYAPKLPNHERELLK